MRPRNALTDFTERRESPMVIGHRGYSSLAPENTLAAFELIRAHGIEAVELDVHRCATGEIVVAHDDTLERTAGVSRAIGDTPFDELREYDVGGFFDPRFAGERVPLLEEVLELLGTNCFFDVEIKHYASRALRPRPATVEAATVELIRRHGMVGRCIVSSFDPLVLRRVRLLAPEIPVAAIYASSAEMPYLLRRAGGRAVSGATVMKPHHASATVRHIRGQHRRGRLVMPWTVDDPELALELAARGADAIITNRPGEIRSALRQARGELLAD